MGSTSWRNPGRDEQATDILCTLGNKYSAEILCAAQTPTSAQELSDQVGIPIATCYRRIEELVDAGLLQCEGRQLSNEGRRTNVYRRTLDELAVNFSEPDPAFTRKERSEAKNRLQDKME
ncbi:ArsR/SmtB family transcription factor [Haloarchaeobius sp. TZWWS8]|uniref:ArsR/SmtB family transcription factor n=1 Tax=Haloarchaeobius sp. TZWWS8 TaxID=3446121 RepID=UPI003EB7F33C